MIKKMGNENPFRTFYPNPNKKYSQVVDVASNAVASQRVVPLTRLRPGYRHLRLHNELDQPLPLSQLFLCSQFLDGDLVDDDDDGIDHIGAEEGDVYKDSPVTVEDGGLDIILKVMIGFYDTLLNLIIWAGTGSEW